jgi:hypothetical protein
MTAANTAPGSYAEHVIVLGAGLFPVVGPDPSAPTSVTGLPLVTGGMTLLGAGATLTEIAPQPASRSPVRFFEVAAGGTLVLADLALTGGQVTYPQSGSAVKNSGTLALYRTIVRWNTGATALWTSGVFGMVGGNVYGNSGSLPEEAPGLVVADGVAQVVDSFLWWNVGGPISDGSAIFVKQGSLTVRGSTLSHNETGGTGAAISNGGFNSPAPGGTVLVEDSFIGMNGAGFGAGLFNKGAMEVVNSTLYRNSQAGTNRGDQAEDRPTGVMVITNSTIVHLPIPTTNLEGLFVAPGGVVFLQNSILWGGTPGPDPHTPSNDCEGTVLSLGGNVIGDPTGCMIQLQPNDRVGDPGLDAFVDVAQPGQSYFPLLPTSQARGLGDPALCPQVDQLGAPRKVRCDSGAIERFEGTGGVAQR